MSRAGIYARISEDRNGPALGVARQLEDCRAYAERRGWTVVAEFVDNDVSATNRRRQRPEYLRLLAEIERGAIDAVVVWALDRLHRRPTELEAFIDLADKHGVALGSIGGDVDLATPAGRLHARIMGSVAKHEVEHKGQRIQRAALQRAQAGGNHGGRRAFGYTPDGLHLIPNEACEVTRLFEDFLAGVPLGALARDLNARNVSTVQGGPWTTQALAYLLRAPRYAGLSVYRGEVVGKGQWPAIVSEETWRAARGVLADPSRRTSTGNKPVALIAGLATCGACGGKITSGGLKRHNKSKTEVKIYPMYRCRNGSCVYRRRDWVDELVTLVILERLSRPDAADLMRANDRPDTDALRSEALALHGRLAEAAGAFADGDITTGQLKTVTERLRGRLSEIETALQHWQRAPILTDLVSASDVRAVWHSIGLDRQRAVVALLAEVTLHPGGGGQRGRDLARLAQYVEIKWRDEP